MTKRKWTNKTVKAIKKNFSSTSEQLLTVGGLWQWLQWRGLDTHFQMKLWEKQKQKASLLFSHIWQLGQNRFHWGDKMFSHIKKQNLDKCLVAFKQIFEDRFGVDWFDRLDHWMQWSKDSCVIQNLMQNWSLRSKFLRPSDTFFHILSAVLLRTSL